METASASAHLLGNPPYQFLTLAHTADAVVKPMQYTILAGEPKPIALNGPLAEAKFQAFVEIGAKPGEFTLKDAEAGDEHHRTPAENGKVKLVLEPRVQHGSRQFGYKPTSDATAFTWLRSEDAGTLPLGLKFGGHDRPRGVPADPARARRPANTLGGAPASFRSTSSGPECGCWWCRPRSSNSNPQPRAPARRRTPSPPQAQHPPIARGQQP